MHAFYSEINTCKCLLKGNELHLTATLEVTFFPFKKEQELKKAGFTPLYNPEWNIV